MQQSNGMMFAKERKICSLQETNAQLNSQLDALMLENKSLLSEDGNLSKQINNLERQSNMVEVELMMSQRKSGELAAKLEKLSSLMVTTTETHDAEYKQMIAMEKQMAILKDESQRKLLFLKRLTRQNEVTQKQTKNSGEGNKMRDALQRAEREVQILQGKLEGKKKFMSILVTKKSENDRGLENRGKTKDFKEGKKVNSIEGLLENVEKLKLEKLKSFERIVRNKNAVLLKSKSQHKY